MIDFGATMAFVKIFVAPHSGMSRIVITIGM